MHDLEWCFILQLRNSLNYWLILWEINDNVSSAEGIQQQDNLVLTCEPHNSWFCNMLVELGQPPDTSGFITGFPIES